MKSPRLRTDLERAVIDGFALPLGIEPGRIDAPRQGYIIAYTPGQDDEPDTYAFHVVVSHERLAPIVRRAFELLADEVYAIVEINSRDAYRTTDVFIGSDPIRFEVFREAWDRFEPFLLEDGTIAAGANSDEPYVEIFLSQCKGLSIHVPLPIRDDVEALLQGLGLQEVPYAATAGDVDAADLPILRTRSVLELADAASPGVDELLLELRRTWRLALDVDPDTNVDDSGRTIGLTLWHAVIVVEDETAEPPRAGFASIWATAGSLSEIERLIDDSLAEHPPWTLREIYTLDRVAFDERPERLADLPPRREKVEVHVVHINPPPE